MAQAITVKFLPPTSTKPGRYSIKAGAGNITQESHVFFEDTPDVREAKLCGITSPVAFAIWTYLTRKAWDGHWTVGQDHKGDWQAVRAATSKELYGEKGFFKVTLS